MCCIEVLFGASLNINPNRLFRRNHVTSDKVNFKLDIRQKMFLKEIRALTDCVDLKTI